MREYHIDSTNEGQRLDKFLFRILPKAPSSLIYKMLRKKNIVINDRKSDGKDSIKDGDVIKIYMSEDTIEKFSEGCSNITEKTDELYKLMPDIVYEDDNIIIVNKPVGMLSQKAKDDDISCNEICLSYYRHSGKTDSHDNFTPSICNRLDRNTSGLLLFAKTYNASRQLSVCLKDRTIKKYYLCIVNGSVNDEMILSGKLTKNHRNNTVHIEKSDDENIYTEVMPVKVADKISLLEVHLITGKTHQIRAHLASIGAFIIGDYKYGNRAINDYYKKKYGINSQLLCSYKLVMPKFEGSMQHLSGREFMIDMPNEFKKVLADVNMEIKRS